MSATYVASRMVMNSVFMKDFYKPAVDTAAADYKGRREDLVGRNAPGADEASCPVRRVVPLDAHDAAGARGVDELAARRSPCPTCDAPRLTVSKNSRSPASTSSRSTALPTLVLLAHFARQDRAELREDVLHEAAAIEAGRVAAAVPVRHAAEFEGRVHEGWRSGLARTRRSGRRLTRRPGGAPRLETAAGPGGRRRGPRRRRVKAASTTTARGRSLRITTVISV